MKKSLATLTTVVVALALAVLPSVAANAAPPQGQPEPCNQLGYTKFDTSSGNQNITSGAAPIGNLTWSGTSLTYTLQPGWSVDLCIKSGAQVGTVEYAAVTASGTLTIAQNISHIGWKNPVRSSLAPEYGSTNEQCVSDQMIAGGITVVEKAGVAYALTGPGGAIALAGGTSGPLAPGSYALTASDSNPNDGYLVTPLSTTVVIAGFDGECGMPPPTPVAVTPAVTWVDQTCRYDELVGGHITVDLSVPGVTYQIDNGAIAFDGTGRTAALSPGSYTVTAVDADPTDGYTLAAPFSQTVAIASAGAYCGEDDDYEVEDSVFVSPRVEVTNQTCEGTELIGGRILVDLTIPGIAYTIGNGSTLFDENGNTTPLAPGEYLVTVLDIDPNDKFELLEAFSRTLTVLADDSGECAEILDDTVIVEPPTTETTETTETCESDCGEQLSTLAVTGATPGSAIGLAGLLALLGAGLVAAGLRRERVREES